MTKNILVIEDDAEIADMLRVLLTRNGYSVTNAYSGTEGLLVHGNSVDLILLDLMLPGKSGDQMIGELKQKKPVPIIIMSAIDDISKKVDMFSLGADDYITKPFHNDELLARIAARLRTGNNISAASEVLKYQDLVADKANHTVTISGKTEELSVHEFGLLWLLMENPNRTCTKSMIYDAVWDYENSADDNTLNVHISKLRKKLKELSPDHDYIETVWGVGYRLRK